MRQVAAAGAPAQPLLQPLSQPLSPL